MARRELACDERHMHVGPWLGTLQPVNNQVHLSGCNFRPQQQSAQSFIAVRQGLMSLPPTSTGSGQNAMPCQVSCLSKLFTGWCVG